MNWLEAIIARIAELWPWVRIRPWQASMRTTFVPFRPATVTVIKGPVIARDLPWFDDNQIRDVQEDTYNLPTQSVTTKDDVAVSFSANFVYEIEDVKLAVSAVKQFDTSLQDLAMVHLADRISQLTWADLLADQRKLERSLQDTLTTQARRWGVRVKKAGFTDLVKAKQFRHFGDTSFASTL